MPDNKVNYEVEIKRTGTGATDAANDLKKIDEQAQKSNRSLGSLALGFKSAILAIAGSAVIRESSGNSRKRRRRQHG